MKTPAQTLPQQAPRARCHGFTYAEVLMATALTAVVMSQVVTALVTSQRLFESTVADLELSLHSRELREKVLFNIIPDEGGLMNISQSELTIENGKKGWGDGIRFKPKKGPGNRLALGKNKKLKADRGNPAWLARGAFILQTNELFCAVASNGTILVNLDVAIPVNGRIYGQRHQIQSQILNE